MHWESHEFALPKLPRGMKWHIAIRTDAEKNGIYPEGKEPLLPEQKKSVVPPRTIVVFIGKTEAAVLEEKSKPEAEHE